MADLFDNVSGEQAEGLLLLGWRRVPRDRAHGYGDWERPDGSCCTETEARTYWERLQKEPPCTPSSLPSPSEDRP